jgi:hypothetical protein
MSAEDELRDLEADLAAYGNRVPPASLLRQFMRVVSVVFVFRSSR